MHIMHLACAPDCICSILLDLTDGGNRDSKLAELWESYRQWCEHGGSLAEKYLTPSLFLKMLGGALNGLLTPMKSMFHFFLELRQCDLHKESRTGHRDDYLAVLS